MSRMKVKDIPYQRYDVDGVRVAFEKFVAAEKNASTAEDVLSARKEFLDAVGDYSTYASLAYMRYTLNTRDEFYLAEQEYYDENGPVADTYMTKYAEIMLASRFRPELEKLLPETIFPRYECTKKAHSDETVSDEQEENSIVTEYSQLMSQLTTDWRGEQKTISYIRGFMEDSDREVRKAAANAIGTALSSVSDKLDDIFDRLVKVRTRIAKKLGYKDFVELGYYRMGRIDYDRDMVANFRKNVKEDVVPVVVELKKSIANALGIEKMAFYDNDVIEGEGNPRPYPDAEGILRAANETYREMSDETGSFMAEMLEAEAFDTLARDGKWGGGYCTCFEKFRQPFILANFNGSSGDVDVVTHEFGHALAMNYIFDYGDIEAGIGSSETAETHSMSMEFFCWKFMDKFFKDANRYRYKHLADALSFIPYGVIIDEFQHIVYENPDMTPAERNEAYLNLEKKYRPYLSYDGIEYLEKGTRWQYQMHVYETPFYYIDYCLAQVVALEFLSDSQKDYEDALGRYFDHAKRGGLYAFNRLVKLAGLKSPFENGALKDVAATSTALISRLRD